MACADLLEFAASPDAQLRVPFVELQACAERGDDVRQQGIAGGKFGVRAPSHHPVAPERDMPRFVRRHRLEEGTKKWDVPPEIPAGPQLGEEESFEDSVKANDARGGGPQILGVAEELPKGCRRAGSDGSDVGEERAVAVLFPKLPIEERPISLKIPPILEQAQEVDSAGFAVGQVRCEVGEE